MVNILDQDAFGSNYENGGGMDVPWHPEINVKGAHFIKQQLPGSQRNDLERVGKDDSSPTTAVHADLGGMLPSTL